MHSEMHSELRWAFRSGSWRPKQSEWEKGLSSIQTEELQRLGKYIFRKDRKSKMAGRLLLRRAVHTELDIAWDEIQLGRTQHGKPFLVNRVPGFESFSVNVSHHGEFTVLAASRTCQVGVDVVKLEWPHNNSSVDRLFGLLSDQFTEYEWRTIQAQDDEWDQLCLFYRLWSLKESYVKALGIGLNMDLQRIEFRISSDLQRGKCTRDTRLYVDGKLEKKWRFEESLLDASHSVATALSIPDNQEFPLENLQEEPRDFKKLSIKHLMEHAQPLGHDIPTDSYQSFQKLKEKP